MTPRTHAPIRRIDGLDTLRALAILLVFAYHYMCFVSQQPTFGWFSELGWVGVDLFFVLSGYLISNQIFAGLVGGERLSLPRFYARRALRTLPNFYVVLAFYFLLPQLMDGRSPPPLWRFLSFTQNIQLQPGTAFSHAWSLCIEEQFYLLLPAVTLLAVASGRRIKLAWALIGGLMLGGVLLRGFLWTRHASSAIDYYQNIYYASLCRMDEFLPGVAVALLKNFHRGAWAVLMRRGQVLLMGGLAACALMAVLLGRYYYVEPEGYGFAMTAAGYSLVALSFSLLLLAALSPHSTLHRVRIPGAASLAAWSYAIYLTHKPLAVIVQRQVMAPLGLAPDKLSTAALIAAACCLGGWLLFRVVERPFMRLRDQYLPSNNAPVEKGAMQSA